MIADTGRAGERANAMKSDRFNLSRRSLLTSLACASGVSSLVLGKSLQSPDTELIALGVQFNELTRTWVHLARQTNHTYENVDIVGLIGAINPIEAAIVARRAKTIEGLLVKARAANWSREGRVCPEAEESTDKKMAWSIVRDLLDLSHSSFAIAG